MPVRVRYSIYVRKRPGENKTQNVSDVLQVSDGPVTRGNGLDGTDVIGLSDNANVVNVPESGTAIPVTIPFTL